MTLALLAAVCAPVAQAAPRQTPSGQPVPRYVALKFDKVYARAGPGEDHKLLWVYHAKGLPVQVIAENTEWRRICDPEGGVAWVHRRLTSGENNVMRAKPERLALHKHPRAEAEIIAYLAPRSIAQLPKGCEKGWCKVKAGGVSGWAPASELWGVSDAIQCKLGRPVASRKR
ncbi:SH3-like domain-containing protein [Phenylobacterium koreense]|uniref:SH3-like domain-containing protein n=1 Tax=Phenylobacterium koreense TaxID=266125 RepID=A0ABV2EIC1_9CAUL